MTNSRGQFEESKDALARADSTLRRGEAKALSRSRPEPRGPEVESRQEFETEALTEMIEPRRPAPRGQARPAAGGKPDARPRQARKSKSSQRDSNRASADRSKLGEIVGPTRCLPRQDEVRIARYSRFPRESSDELPRIGFTRDVSALGMCLGVDHAEPIGVLLRIELRSLDGESMGASIARVVWCKDARDGRQWLGLDLLCDIEKPDLQKRLG